MEKILVTGATGFIGQALVQHLLAKNKRVSAAFHRSRPNCLDNQSVNWVNYNLDDKESLFNIALSDVDVVIHLAGLAHQSSKQAQNSLIKINVENTERLVLAASNAGVKRFIFISTIKVYGEISSAEGFTEIDLPNPSDLYGESKLLAENRLIKICETSMMQYTIFRVPLVFGPGVKANFFDLMKIVYHGVPLPFSAVENLRSLIYVENLCHAISISLEKTITANKLFLLKDIDISTPQLMKSFSKAFGIQSRIFPMPIFFLKFLSMILLNSGRLEKLITSLTIDDSYFRQLTGWAPAFNFDKSIQETADWYISNYGK